jgi:truncated hemoglobin YjbI
MRTRLSTCLREPCGFSFQAICFGASCKVAISNAKLTYQRYKLLFSGERWKTLASKGARPQRLPWASTGTKNKAYSDVLYVEELIGSNTINTMPPATLEAFRDHGKAETLIQTVVEYFYARVRADKELAPMFERIADWPAHLTRMRDFRPSVTLITARPQGAVIGIHLSLPSLNDHHSLKRLELFAITTRDHCTPEQAAMMRSRALRITESIRAARRRTAWTTTASDREEDSRKTCKTCMPRVSFRPMGPLISRR